MTCRKLLLLLIPSILFSATVNEGWEALYNNNPDEALEIFRSIPESSPTEKARALRGEAEVGYYFGEKYEAAELSAASFELDNDPEYFASNIRYLLMWSQSGRNRIDRNIIRQIESANESAPYISPLFNEILLLKQLANGRVSRAEEPNSAIGIVNDWQFIGPFENSAGMGFNAVYPPEIEIDPEAIYSGKGQNNVSWSPLTITTPDPWIRLENHSSGVNNIWYFAASVNSPIEQEGYLTFGASARFKIFQNGVELVTDSIFRNTGLNSYLTPITLQAGVNTFMVKVGYELQDANFALGILDRDFSPFENVQPLSELVDVDSEGTIASTETTLMVDSLASYLNALIETDSSNLEAVSTLISMYTIHNRTEEAEAIVHTYLEKYPESSYLLENLGDCYQRQRRITEAQDVFKRAYELSSAGETAWQFELSRLINEGNRPVLTEFLDNSDSRHKESVMATISRITIYASEGKIAQAMDLVDELRENHSQNSEVVALLYSLYLEGGVSDAAEEVLRTAVDEQPYSLPMRYALGEFLTQNGQTQKAMDVYHDAIDIFPQAPRSYYLIAYLLTGHNQFEEALPYIDKVLELTPNSATAYQLKGRILQQLERTDDAIACYEEAIQVTNNDFIFWESLRELQGKPSWYTIAPVPDVDSLIEVSIPWRDSIGKPVTLLSYIEDIIRYPSRAIRERTFFIINLADRDAVEEWKEYQIGYGVTQSLEILQASTIKQSGRWIPADRTESGAVVFKSIEPGDNIVLEYTLLNYKHSGMTGMIYGEQAFTTPLPVYQQELRFVAPINDSVPYRISGNLLEPNQVQNGDFMVTSFSPPADTGNMGDNTFQPEDYEGKPKIIFSDFESWNQIAQWYSNLTAAKSETSSSVQDLADSLFADITDPWDKVRRTHKYITDNIVYSYVPFRQSGWIPQSTSEILATRIGDCKDMALLGRTLLRLGDIPAELILVNTEVSQYIDNAFIGPNFDHAILSATVGDSTIYIDLTSNNSSLGTLPIMDQGAMALSVTDSSESVFTLPVDSPEGRSISRNLTVSINDEGTATYVVSSTKRGVWATQMRNAYRYKSSRERLNYMERLLQEENQAVTVDSLVFNNIDTLGNEVSYSTFYSVENGASVRNGSAVFRLGIPDQITSSYFPAISDRIAPISLRYYYRSISDQNTSISIEYPEEWELVNIPETVQYSSPSGEYSLTYLIEGNLITINRKVTMNFDSIYTVDNFADNHEFLSSVALADDIEFIFTK